LVSEKVQQNEEGGEGEGEGEREREREREREKLLEGESYVTISLIPYMIYKIRKGLHS
jgi:hypothetical protein